MLLVNLIFNDLLTTEAIQIHSGDDQVIRLRPNKNKILYIMHIYFKTITTMTKIPYKIFTGHMGRHAKRGNPSQGCS